MHPPGLLARRARADAEVTTCCLIADEIAVGMGRTGTMFACEQEDVVPDFLCLGKGLTGGYLPMAATMTNDRDLQRVSGRVARRPDAAPRAHVQRQSAGGGRGAGVARCVRRGADAGEVAGEDRAARASTCAGWPSIRTSPARGNAA